MCDPLTIGSAVATVGGMYLQQQGAKQAEKARRGVMDAETARQAGYDAERKTIFDGTLKNFDRGTQDATQAALQAKRGETIDGAVNPGAADASAGLSASAPKEIRTNVARALNKSVTGAREEGSRLAAMRSFGDLQFGNLIDLTRSGLEQNRLGSYSAGSSNVLPLELSAANNKGAGSRQFGQLLQGAGAIAGLGGALGLGPSWSSLGFGGAPTGAAATGGAAGQLVSSGSTPAYLGPSKAFGFQPILY